MNQMDCNGKNKPAPSPLQPGMGRMGSSTKADSGADPQLVEDDIFRIIIPLTAQVTGQVTEQVTEQVKKLRKIIKFCKTPGPGPG